MEISIRETNNGALHLEDFNTRNPKLHPSTSARMIFTRARKFAFCNPAVHRREADTQAIGCFLYADTVASGWIFQITLTLYKGFLCRIGCNLCFCLDSWPE